MHPLFASKPKYQQQLTLQQYRNKAQHARHAGYYNLTTLWYFRKAWCKSQTLEDYLYYLAFRHDLGYPVSARQRQRLLSWHTAGGAIIAKLFRLVWALCYRRAAKLLQKMLRTPLQQHQQLAALQQHLTQAGSIQLVGNSATLINSQLGNAIDSAPVVLRFNLCFSAQTQSQDTGTKTDIWVGAPDFKYAAPTASWYIITGPDMLNWLDTLPPAFQQRQPLVSVPLQPWRELVKILGAPPSAGLLTLYWFRQWLPNCEYWLCGFTIDHTQRQYHHADHAHQPVSRHNWQQERLLLQQWQVHNQISTGCKEISL